MALVINVILDLLLVGTLVLFAFGLVQLVIREPNPMEKLLRGMALVAGAVVALGAQAANVGYASFTVDALAGTRASGGFFDVVGVIVPGGVGVAFGWYFLRVLRRSTQKGLRLICFMGMLTVVGFAAIFAEATNVQGVELGAAALPNASLVAGIILSILVFAPEPGTEAASAARGSRWASLGNLVLRRAPQHAAFLQGKQAASEVPTAPAAVANPFDD